MAAIIAPGTVIGALVIVALTVIVFYACRNKVCYVRVTMYMFIHTLYTYDVKCTCTYMYMYVVYIVCSFVYA